MKNLKIDVGNVIYIIDSAQRTVIPARVDEQVVSRKINGETTTHKIELPNGKVGVLENLDVRYFMDLEGVREHLMARAAEVIEQGIENARIVAKSKFSNNTTNTEAISPVLEDPSRSEKVKVTLPDGQVANVELKIPEEFMNENSGN